MYPPQEDGYDLVVCQVAHGSFLEEDITFIKQEDRIPLLGKFQDNMQSSLYFLSSLAEIT